MSRTVLIVEDDPDIQEYLSVILGDLGVEILRAYHGQEALDLIDGGRQVDLILLDVVMPVMDGESFFRELRHGRRSSIPVILASVDEALTARIKPIGEIQGIFMKGRPGGELRDLVREVMAGSPPA